VRDRAGPVSIERVSSVKDGAVTSALRGPQDLPNCNQPGKWTSGPTSTVLQDTVI